MTGPSEKQWLEAIAEATAILQKKFGDHPEQTAIVVLAEIILREKRLIH